MKQTVNRSQFHDAFNAIRPENFSYEGLNALYNYLEAFSEELYNEKEYELDVIALCCDFQELLISEALEAYNLDDLDQLKDETLVVWHDDNNVLFQVY